jgi:hypothetical protein
MHGVQVTIRAQTSVQPASRVSMACRSLLVVYCENCRDKQQNRRKLARPRHCLLCDRVFHVHGILESASDWLLQLLLRLLELHRLDMLHPGTILSLCGLQSAWFGQRRGLGDPFTTGAGSGPASLVGKGVIFYASVRGHWGLPSDNRAHS